jgi:hypothetical protein
MSEESWRRLLEPLLSRAGFDAGISEIRSLQECLSAKSFGEALDMTRDVGIALDIAASSFGADGVYRLPLEGRGLSSTEMVEMIMHWCSHYPIVSIEDPVGEDDDFRFVSLSGWATESRSQATTLSPPTPSDLKLRDGFTPAMRLFSKPINAARSLS